ATEQHGSCQHEQYSHGTTPFPTLAGIAPPPTAPCNRPRVKPGALAVQRWPGGAAFCRQIEHLDQRGEPHRPVDVALRDMDPEAFEDQVGTDQHDECQ